MIMAMNTWHTDVLNYLLAADYSSVTQYYERLIDQEPNNQNYCCYLGLSYLLSGDEESAQTSWLMLIAQAPETEVELWIKDLTNILQQEAEQQFTNGDTFKSWLIRCHIKEINPNLLDNLLGLIQLDILLDQFEPKSINEWEIISLLKQNDPQEVNTKNLFKTVQNVLKYPTSESIEFAKFSAKYAIPLQPWISMLIAAATNLGYYQNSPLLGIDLLHLCLQLRPNELGAIEHLPRLYLEAHQYQDAIQSAVIFYEQSNTLDLKFYSNAILLKSMLSAGAWRDISPISERHKNLLKQLIDTQPILSLGVTQSLSVFTGYLFYIQDNLQENRWFLNKISELFHKNLIENTSIELPLCLNYYPHKEHQLRIGYIASTLRNHSVGWLSRWLFQHHDRSAFNISLYLLGQSQQDPFFGEWFAPKVDASHFFADDIPAISEKIRDDKIDILIDLDSITLDQTITVMGLKPAPIQVSWLGWDASGVPTVDYFIADPYVLPENAQQHYHEKILRLPQTYIAVDGFEVDVPNLRRDDLGIPSDGIIYYSSQAGLKRHPDTVKLQLQILKDVPNSYFLMKGLADEKSIQEMVLDLASEINISKDRLKFLPMTPTEYIHRANLGIADVVLDTFPYNGATTTLETLWMGIPLVTQVGTQFAARNSYAFLMNVGVSEGIAWSAEEYVEWGIRFGRDSQLRLDVAWKLKQSRQTSALWNTKQFTHNMEETYQNIWQTYIETH
jgi:predicted O-linked N-acetylglucosamine transferase (SPINDLY family)